MDFAMGSRAALGFAFKTLANQRMAPIAGTQRKQYSAGPIILQRPINP